MHALATITRLLNNFFGLLAGLFFFAAGVIMFVEVVCRFCGNPTSWINETSVYLFAAGMLMGLPYTLMRHRHVRVELFISRLGPEKCRTALRLASLAGMCFCLMVTWFAFWEWLELVETGETSFTSLRVPLWVTELPLVVSFALLSLEFLLQALRVEQVPVLDGQKH